MNGDTRRWVVTPLLVIFGAKLAVTGWLLKLVVDGSAAQEWSVFLALVGVVLGALATLQLFVMVGLSQHWKSARQVADRVCVAGVAFGCLILAIAPFTWFLAVVGLFLGIGVVALNGLAWILLGSEPLREWCDVDGDALSPRTRIGFEPRVVFKPAVTPMEAGPLKTRSEPGGTTFTGRLTVAAVVAFFGGKLCVTGSLLTLLARSGGGSSEKSLVILALAALAASQLAAGVGVWLGRGWALALGDRLCTVGAVLASVMVVLGPLTIYLAFFLVGAGLVLFFLNGGALLLLRSEAVRVWCGPNPGG